MDIGFVYQLQNRKWLEEGINKSPMITVYGFRNSPPWSINIQSYLIPSDNVEEELLTTTYNSFRFSPGVSIKTNEAGNQEEVYSRWNDDKGMEPLVIEREFYGLAVNEIEIAEEFRLLFNLYYNSSKKQYVDLINGEIPVVSISDNDQVAIHKKYLKTYLAVKKKALIVHMYSCYSNEPSEKISWPTGEIKHRSPDSSLHYSLQLAANHNGLNLSILCGKKAIYGCDLKDCIIWPYNEEQEKKYIDFIIGVDEDGKEILHTCNPFHLSNYFGANPTEPHYLTPVYFDAAVLDKYYSKPEIYKVEDGYVQCGTLWAIDIDNPHDGYVSAYLGDLGEKLPSEQEQYYWRSFNKPIGGKLSDAKINRDFFGIDSESISPDIIFKRLYEGVNSDFNEKHGWPLFLELGEQDQHNFNSLRVPIINSIAEMDMLVLSLVKVLLDSLNEAKIVSQLTQKYEKLSGSISKLEAWFSEKGLANYQEHISFLRDLQQLRSSGSGHRKGKSYQKIAKKFGIQSDNYAESFEAILNDASSFLLYVKQNIENLA